MQIGEEKEIEIQDFFELSKMGGIYEIETPNGWVEIGDLVLKRNKECYLIRTESGNSLNGSEDHYVETKNGWEKLKDLNVNTTTLHTSYGEDDVVAKEYTGTENTYDLEVLNNEHKYYANKIISHNTGKTMICKVLIKELPVTILYVLPTHIRDRSDVAKICDMAKDLSPTLLILEDIDYLAEDREGTGAPGWSVIDLMNKMDGIEGFENVVTLATTNLIEKVENAIKNRPGRFDRVISLKNPSSEGIVKMLQNFTQKFKVNDKIKFEKLAEKLNDMSGAYIKDLCITAALLAIQENSVDENGIAILLGKHFTEALREIKDKDFSKNFVEPRQMGFMRRNEEDFDENSDFV
jgi:AAA+ superfamily predicted ATPase